MGKSSHNTTPRYLLLGEILRPHGIRGELRVRILTDYPERIPELKQVYIGVSPEAANIKAYAVETMRMHKGYGLLKLKEVATRNDAELLRTQLVMIDLASAVPLEEGEFYLFQLIGLAVYLEEGELLGHISDVIETGANDVYIVESPQYGEVLIPAIEQTILDIDFDTGVMRVRLLDGLLPPR